MTRTLCAIPILLLPVAVYGQCFTGDKDDLREENRNVIAEWSVIPASDNLAFIADLQQEASEGDVSAQLLLGNLYAFGEDSTRNYAKAVKYYEAAGEFYGTDSGQNVGVVLGRILAKALAQEHGLNSTFLMPSRGNRMTLRDISLAGIGGSTACWQDAGELGFVPAQVLLAERYYIGWIGHERRLQPNLEKAAYWWRKVGETGNVGTDYWMGTLSSGCDDAEYWYLRAAQEGHREAQYKLARLYHRGECAKNIVEAIKWYRMSAEQGKLAAQAWLGLLYDMGIGVPEDDFEAVKWYRIASEQGHPSSQYFLGVMYDKGEGVPEDDSEAIKWYRMGALRGESRAQASLARMYVNGEGVQKDIVAGYAWMNVAAIGGDQKIADAKDRIRSAMTYEQVTAGQKLSNEIFGRLESGNSEAVGDLPDLESVRLKFHSDLESIRI